MIFKKSLIILFFGPLQAQEMITHNRLLEFAKSAYSTIPTIENSYTLAKECLENNIEGDFVECGVAFGAQVAAMNLACEEMKTYRHLHLFDSFEGIPLASKNDATQPGIGAITHNVNVDNLDELLVSSGVTCVTLETVKFKMNQWSVNFDYLHFYKGWFQHTLPVFASKIEKIALLRLDGDLYESTKICLEYLYEKVTDGGYVIIDDYALAGCHKAVHEFLNKHNLKPDIQYVQGGLGVAFWKK